ncbi:hypothetical protein ECDEC8A_4858 [Escherichia coli DEC8A]|nr:hypothetical protein ECDEC8A_4858 [Escherichia coli DEC8A]
MCVVTGRGVVFNVRSVDGDTTSFFSGALSIWSNARAAPP